MMAELIQKLKYCKKHSHYDADGAKEGGIDCIGVGYGFGGAEEMWNAGAVAVYEDQKALREALV